MVGMGRSAAHVEQVELWMTSIVATLLNTASNIGLFEAVRLLLQYNVDVNYHRWRRLDGVNWASAVQGHQALSGIGA